MRLPVRLPSIISLAAASLLSSAIGGEFAGAQPLVPGPPPLETWSPSPRTSSLPPQPPPRREEASQLATGTIPATQIIAEVGDQVILAGDILPQIDEALAPMAARFTRPEVERARREQLERLLPRVMESKLLYLDFLSEIPQEHVGEIRRRVGQAFDRERLPDLIEKAECTGPLEYEQHLRKYGSSIAKQRNLFIENAFAAEMLRKNVNRDVEVTFDEMLDAYEQNLEKYRVPAQATWERLSVHFDRTPSRKAAWRQIAEMGNRIYLGGADFAEVARTQSHGVRAEKGGRHVDTTPGSLRSRVLDQAVFSLPPGKLSQILEDERGYHIIRVIERTDAGVVPFEEAQEKIRDEIRAEKLNAQVKTYLDRLRAKTAIRTIFDNHSPPPGG